MSEFVINLPFFKEKIKNLFFYVILKIYLFLDNLLYKIYYNRVIYTIL